MGFHLRRACLDAYRLTRCVPYFRRYERLMEEFHFDPWHVQSPYPRRPYKSRVVALANGLAPDTLVEIGCGLGEIVARCKARRRFGFDSDANVIAAAEALHGNGVVFAQGDLRQADHVSAAVASPIDVLIAVNWPHMLPFDAFADAVAGLAAHVPVRALVIDTIRPGGAGYQHFHGLSDLQRLGTVEQTIGGGDFIRDLHVVRLGPGIVPCAVPDGHR